MHPLVFAALLMLVFVVMSTLVRHLASPKKTLPYSPHHVRKIEQEIFGEVFTKCANGKCTVCYPKALPPPPKGPAGVGAPEAPLQFRTPVYGTPKELPRTRVVRGYEVFMPPEVPDNAHAFVEPYGDGSNLVQVHFRWTDQETGQLKGLKTFPTQQFVPKAEYHEVMSWDGKVSRFEPGGRPDWIEMQLPNPGRISRF